MEWRHVLSETTLGPEEQEAVLEVLRSEWLSMGPRTRAFEEAFASQHGVRHAIAVSSGTAALHLALSALDVGRGEGDEVVQPAMNFVAGANMTIALGARPVFADIVSLLEPTIDPEATARCLTERTRAVMVMHYGGYPVRLEALRKICAARDIPIVEDACHAPCQRLPSLGGRALGTIGRIGCFSFFPNKNMTTGEGGMVVTDDDDLAEKIRWLRSHGMTTLSWDRHKGRATTYDVTQHGFNYRVDELRAAIGICQLGKVEAANARRREVAQQYADHFSAFGCGCAEYVFGDDPKDGTAHVAAVLVPAEIRDQVRAGLKDRGIQSSLHYPPVHLFSAFAGDPARQSEDLRLTESFADRVITLPIHPRMADADVQEIAGAVVELAS